jgi:hypothetical protein
MNATKWSRETCQWRRYSRKDLEITKLKPFACIKSCILLAIHVRLSIVFVWSESNLYDNRSCYVFCHILIFPFYQLKNVLVVPLTVIQQNKQKCKISFSLLKGCCKFSNWCNFFSEKRCSKGNERRKFHNWANW